MTMRGDRSHNDPLAVVGILRTAPNFPQDEAKLLSLAQAIMPYLEQTGLDMPDAAIRIATNYLHDGPRVERLLADPEAEDWHEVMVQVVEAARRRRRYPDDVDAHSWPDLDAYEDIRKKLPSYKFEGPFEHWITVITIKRLHRFWRDQQAEFRGGGGFQSKEDRDTAAAAGQSQHSPRDTMQSLDLLLETSRSAANILADPSLSLEHVVAAAELYRLLEEVVTELAEAMNEPRLFDMWRAVVIGERTLREVAHHFGQNITFIQRRVKLVQKHLQQDARLRDWHKPDDT